MIRNILYDDILVHNNRKTIAANDIIYKHNNFRNKCIGKNDYLNVIDDDLF